LPIDYYQTASHSMDVESGDKTTTYTKIRIQKAIVLRAREFRSFVYDLAYISANKDFTTGGFFDPEDRRVLIDSVDLPFKPTIDDYYIFQNEKYEVAEIFSFEDDYAYAFLARKLGGSKIVRIEDTLSVMGLEDTASSETQDVLEREPTTALTLTHTLEEVP